MNKKRNLSLTAAPVPAAVPALKVVRWTVLQLKVRNITVTSIPSLTWSVRRTVSAAAYALKAVRFLPLR